MELTQFHFKKVVILNLITVQPQLTERKEGQPFRITASKIS